MTTNTNAAPITAQPEALRLAAWLNDGAWHRMTLGDVEAAGRELRRLHALSAVAQPPADEREAFEHAERASNLARDEEGDYVNPCVQSSWEGWQARAKFGVARPPAGWVVVPVESTTAMEWAFRRADTTYPDGAGRRLSHDPHSAFKAQYAALLAAAPKAEPVQPERRNTKTHELLSSLIGIVLGAQTKIGYTNNSQIAKEVAQAIEHLKDWPYPTEPVLQPERVPLTDEQIVILRHKTRNADWAPRASDLAFARAIEAAHGIQPEHKE